MLILSDKPEMTLTEKHRLFEVELLPHIGALDTFAYHLTLDESAANDLVQETYLNAFKSIEHYDQGTNAKAWLFKILKNVFINEYRRKRRFPTISESLDQPAGNDPDEGKPIEQFVDLREEMFNYLIGDEVTRAVNAMPVEFRTVILLCDVEDFSYEEIALILDIPVGTVRSRLFRARNLLKEKLDKYARSLGYRDRRLKLKNRQLVRSEQKNGEF